VALAVWVAEATAAAVAAVTTCLPQQNSIAVMFAWDYYRRQ